MKDASFDELVMAIRTVSEGEVYVDSTAMRPVVEGYLRESETQQTPSKRERQILGLIVEGHRNREIAKELGISKKTVDRHRCNLMKKLDVHSFSALISVAVSMGISIFPEHKTPPPA